MPTIQCVQRDLGKFLFAVLFVCTSHVGQVAWGEEISLKNTDLKALANEAIELNPCPSALAAEGAPSPVEGQKWDLTLSPFTYHWNYNPEHHPVFLMAIDRHVAGGRFCGISLFRNSFGQPTGYVYVGQQWDGLMGNPKMFVKLSAGLIDGYRGKYQDKIPFNNYGVAPAVIPAVGYRHTPEDSFQIMLLGNAAILFAYGRRF